MIFFAGVDANDDVDEVDDGTFFGGIDKGVFIDRSKQYEMGGELILDGDAIPITASVNMVFRRILRSG